MTVGNSPFRRYRPINKSSFFHVTFDSTPSKSFILRGVIVDFYGAFVCVIDGCNWLVPFVIRAP